MNATENKKVINTLLKQKSEIEIMRQLATGTGFYSYYFSVLKNHKTKEQAFDKVNELYFQFFSEKRFQNFSDFNKNLKRHYN